MNQLAFSQQVRVISLLTEGNSIRATERLTGIHRDTIMRLSKRIGDDCHRLHHARMRQLQVSCLELDETWSFVRKKQQNLQEHDPAEFGDTYLWVALDAHTKVIVSYLAGKRTGEYARMFVTDLRERIVNQPQLTTDAYAPYIDAIAECFGEAAHVMLNKKAGYVKAVMRGRPDLDYGTTNHTERVNLTVRTQLQRHTRRTSGHSKKLENHRAAIALMIAHYNFVRVHETLCVTPAMEFGLSRHVWSVAELIQEAEAAPTDLEPLPTPTPLPRPDRQPFRLRVIRGGRIS